jgi:hypothetical protein
MLTRVASCDGGSTKKWCGSRDHRKTVRLIESGAVLIAFRIGRTQVDLRRRNTGMSQLLPQGFDVNAVLVPPCSVQNAKRMAGLLRLLDGVADLVRLVDEAIDDPVQVLVHRLCRWGWEINASFGALPRYFLRQASSVSLTAIEVEFWFEANRNGLLPLSPRPEGVPRPPVPCRLRTFCSCSVYRR